VKFAWIDQRTKQYPVKQLCELLEVSRSGFYAWKARPASVRAGRRERLAQQIRMVHEQSRRTYGSPRVHAQLIEQDVEVCVNTVAKLMREEGLGVEKKRRFVPQTTDSRHGHPIAGNHLDRDFEASAPNRKWTCDLTYLWTEEGWLFLAVVIDLYSRKVVGWSMADHLRSELAEDALSMALTRRKPAAELLHHSDRGVQYACRSYRELLTEHSIQASMSRTGNCYDNAVTESFFASLKKECVYRNVYKTRQEARLSVFEWIEVFYNRQRRHSSLGYLSPATFEAQNN
jgi:transposase InsO family protein